MITDLWHKNELNIQWYWNRWVFTCKVMRLDFPHKLIQNLLKPEHENSHHKEKIKVNQYDSRFDNGFSLC